MAGVEAIERLIIQKSDGKFYLSKIIPFLSPSGAATFVLGGSINGWIEWKDKDGKTLDEVTRRNYHVLFTRGILYAIYTGSNI